ncbi:MAG: class I SAM-dependent RNA methyltransferase [Desulfobacteraceae bacterium]|nr:class I SAM-dependent RNA methyltransferase [Desulfobacteraceae bacterium]
MGRERHTVTIDKVVAGGEGLGRLASGLVVMVPHVLPGERVRLEVGKARQGFAPAQVLELLEPAPQRVEPACPHFGRCGGCHLQHGDYPAQLAIKEAILRELANRGGLAVDEAVWRPILPSPSPWGYRQRLRLQIDEAGRVGFFAARSHQVIAVDHCPLAVAPVNQALAGLLAHPGFRRLTANLQAVELLHHPQEGRVVMILHLRRRPRPADQQAARRLAHEVGPLASVWLAGEGFVRNGPYGEGEGGIGFALALPGGRALAMRLEAGGFCQVNLGQNEQLAAQLLEWSEVSGQDRVLDLFCGMGNFSLPLAASALEVLGTDLQHAAIRMAEANAQANGLANCRFRRAPAVAAAKELLAAGSRFDLILLDPPRSGCRELIPLLAGLSADRLLYISCDPATLIRDLAALTRTGYRLCGLRGVDMFPQTCHLEAIALLRR